MKKKKVLQFKSAQVFTRERKKYREREKCSSTINSIGSHSPEKVRVRVKRGLEFWVCVFAAFIVVVVAATTCARALLLLLLCLFLLPSRRRFRRCRRRLAMRRGRGWDHTRGLLQLLLLALFFPRSRWQSLLFVVVVVRVFCVLWLIGVCLRKLLRRRGRRWRCFRRWRFRRWRRLRNSIPGYVELGLAGAGAGAWRRRPRRRRSRHGERGGGRRRCCQVAVPFAADTATVNVPTASNVNCTVAGAGISGCGIMLRTR